MLESLFGLALFAGILSLLLTSVQSSRRAYQEQLNRQEILLVARMAIQTKQSNLSINGHTVAVERTHRQIQVIYQGEEILYVEKR